MTPPSRVADVLLTGADLMREEARRTAAQTAPPPSTAGGEPPAEARFALAAKTGNLTPAEAEEFAARGWVEVVQPYDDGRGQPGRGRATPDGMEILYPGRGDMP